MGKFQQYLPDFAKRLIKQTAYRLYYFTESVFIGSIDKYDPQTIAIFRNYLRPDANCIDIGAHYGHILREMLKSAPRGKHFAFEPIPHLYAALSKKFGRQVRVFNYALSDTKGTATFNLFVDKPALSGLQKRTDYGEQAVENFTVQTERLDDIIPRDIKIDLIKIDVEGAELIVLKGARELLKRDKPIVLFEFGKGSGSAYSTNPEELFDLFEHCDMEVSVIEYFLKQQKGFSREEFCGQYEKGYNYFFIAYPAQLIPSI